MLQSLAIVHTPAHVTICQQFNPTKIAYFDPITLMRARTMCHSRAWWLICSNMHELGLIYFDSESRLPEYATSFTDYESSTCILCLPSFSFIFFNVGDFNFALDCFSGRSLWVSKVQDWDALRRFWRVKCQQDEWSDIRSGFLSVLPTEQSHLAERIDMCDVRNDAARMTRDVLFVGSAAGDVDVTDTLFSAATRT